MCFLNVTGYVFFKLYFPVLLRMCMCVSFRPSPSPFMSSEYPKAMDETDSFFMLEPTEHTNGSFLAVLTRVVSITLTDEQRNSLISHNIRTLVSNYFIYPENILMYNRTSVLIMC